MDHCKMAPFYVSIYLCFNIVYNVVLIVILKYGRSVNSQTRLLVGIGAWIIRRLTILMIDHPDNGPSVMFAK